MLFRLPEFFELILPLSFFIGILLTYGKLYMDNLSAEIGKGRHTHTALILHHQMEHQVPGAFRLMANLLA